MVLLARFLTDERGFSQVTTSTLIMFFTLLICGLSIDMGRLRLAQGNLIVACDSAALSGAMTADKIRNAEYAPVYDGSGNIIEIKENVTWEAQITSEDRAEESARSAFVLNALELSAPRGVTFDDSSDWRGEIVNNDSYKVSARAVVRTVFAGAAGLLTGNTAFLNIPVTATGTARAVADTQ